MIAQNNHKNYKTLEEALIRIEELEEECEMLREELSKYEGRALPGRKPHNEKWQADYAIFVDHYENGESIPTIVETTPFSRRTIYRYKKYYDTLMGKNKDNQ